MKAGERLATVGFIGLARACGEARERAQDAKLEEKISHGDNLGDGHGVAVHELGPRRPFSGTKKRPEPNGRALWNRLSVRSEEIARGRAAIVASRFQGPCGVHLRRLREDSMPDRSTRDPSVASSTHTRLHARARRGCANRVVRWIVPFALTLGTGIAAVGPSACDSSSPVTPSGETGDASLRACDATAENRDPEPDATDDGASKAGSYRQGVNLCCGEGKGLACCPHEMLGDVDSGRDALCYPFGGSFGRCVANGERFESMDRCAFCCDGLTRVSSLYPAPGGPIQIGSVTCDLGDFQTGYTCRPCGNGTCDEGENACNCPGDCAGSDAGLEGGVNVLEGGVTQPSDGGPTQSPDGGPSQPSDGGPSQPPPPPPSPMMP
jgi:hypothetical protein